MISLRVRLLALRALVALGMAAIFGLITIIGGGDSVYAAGFTPQGTVTISDTSPGANPDTTTTFNIAAPDSNFGGTNVGFIGAALADADVPDGAFVATLDSRATLGLVNGGCNTPIIVHFDFFEATTDNSAGNLIDPLPPGTPDDLAPLAGDTNLPPDGTQEIKPPTGVSKYPSFLNAVFDPDFISPGPDLVPFTADDINGPKPPPKPRARYFAATRLPFAQLWVILQFVVFEPGTELPRLPVLDPALGYPSVTVLQNPMPGAVPPQTITDFCTPLESTTTIFGVTKPNPDNGAGGGVPLRTNPAAGEYQSYSFAISQRDADNDGIENGLDPCPFTPDPGWDPRAPTSPADPDGDGIPSSCDPTPNEATRQPGGQPTDHDNDGFPNRGDNCPVVPNGIQGENQTKQRDLEETIALGGGLAPDGGPPADGIGDDCDPNPTTPDGHFHRCLRVTTVTIGPSGPGQAVISACEDAAPPILSAQGGGTGGTGGTGGAGAAGTAAGAATGPRGGAAGGPGTGIGSLAPVASSIPAWAAIASGLGGTGLLGSLAARFLRRRRGG